MIARDDFDSFSDISEAISNEAMGDFERFWRQLDFSNIALAREAAIEYATALVDTYGNASATNAADFFESTTRTSNAYVPIAGNAKRIESVVRYAMKLVMDGDLENALSTIQADMNLQIKGAGRDTIIENARRKKVRFARVPRGARTCEFCVMLASRGFVYHSKQTAGDLNRFHAFCDCQIVAGLPGDKLEGYDPDVYYDRYMKCRKACGSGNEKDILAEMRTRDRAWINGGDAPAPKYEKQRESFTGADDERDLKAHDILVSNGFAITVLAETAPDGYSNIDLTINGKRWEVKSPTSSNIRAVESNLRKAKKQFEKQYGSSFDGIRVVFNGAGIEIPDSDIVSKIEYEMKRHGIDEVLYIGKDDSIKRMKA